MKILNVTNNILIIICFISIIGCATMKKKCFYCFHKQTHLNRINVSEQKHISKVVCVCEVCYAEYRAVDRVFLWHLEKQVQKYRKNKDDEEK